MLGMRFFRYHKNHRGFYHICVHVLHFIFFKGNVLNYHVNSNM